MDINLEYYKIFYYTAKLGRITLAAQELSISQPAVSQVIKVLENKLGIALFFRTPHGVRLTTEGELLYRYVKEGYETLCKGEKKLQESLNLEIGEIRIGASDMTLRFYLLEYLQSFHERYPKIKVVVTNAPTPETLEYMQDGKIDFGVVSEPCDLKGDFEIHRLRSVQDIFVAGEKLEYLQGQSLKYKDLEELPLICLEENTSSRRYINDYLKKNNVRIYPEIELATSDMIVEFARRNFGIGCVMSDFAQQFLHDGSLFALEFEKKIPRRHFLLITNRKSGTSAAARKLLEMLLV